MVQSLILVLSLCIDTFVTSIVYSSNKIKIPVVSGLIIDTICSLFLAISLFFGYLIKDFIPINIASTISFLLLLILGVYRLFEAFFKNLIKKYYDKGSPLTFKIFEFKFILQIYADEIKADLDESKIFSSPFDVIVKSMLLIASWVISRHIELVNNSSWTNAK